MGPNPKIYTFPTLFLIRDGALSKFQPGAPSNLNPPLWFIVVCEYSPILLKFIFCFVMMIVIIGKWSDVNACFVVHDSRLYDILNTVEISCNAVYCNVAFDTLVDVSMLSVYVECLCWVLCDLSFWWCLQWCVLCDHHCMSGILWSGRLCRQWGQRLECLWCVVCSL